MLKRLKMLTQLNANKIRKAKYANITQYQHDSKLYLGYNISSVGKKSSRAKLPLKILNHNLTISLKQ